MGGWKVLLSRRLEGPPLTAAGRSSSHGGWKVLLSRRLEGPGLASGVEAGDDGDIRRCRRSRASEACTTIRRWISADAGAGAPHHLSWDWRAAAAKGGDAGGAQSAGRGAKNGIGSGTWGRCRPAVVSVSLTTTY